MLFSLYNVHIGKLTSSVEVLGCYIKVYLDMNFVKANFMACFCLGGAWKAALSPTSCSLLKVYP